MSRRAVITSLALAVLIVGSLGVPQLSSVSAAPPGRAVPGGPGTVFDPPSVGWLSYRSQTSADFHDTYLERREQFVPIDLEVDTEGGYRVGSVWQRNLDGRSWLVKRNLSSADYREYWKNARDDGYRPTEIETYRVDGSRRWAGLWVRNVEGYAWFSHRGQTAAELDAATVLHRSQGLMPVDLDEYVTGDGRRYNSVWVTSTVRDWSLHRDLTEQEWADTFASNEADSRVLAFESVEVNGKQRYGGVFVTNDNGRGWYFRRDLSRKGYDNWWYRYRDLGYRVVGLDRYQTDDGPRYAATWRQNNDRPTWAWKNEVDDLVADERAVDPDQSGGVAVAIYDDGVPVYLRGFGDADVDDGTWMDSSHISSTASVSKAVAGVLTFRLVEQGLVDLDDLTEDLVPTMPDHHTHTVGQLLSNRGCVGHYDDLPDVPAEDYDTALDASAEFWDEDLVCDPTTDDEDNYSTHGYTLLGAALEAAANDDVKSLVLDELTIPFDLGTLRPQGSSGHRMSLYKDGEEVDAPNNDWKVLGGGLDSSTADLARFGSMLAQGQILSRASFLTLWDPPTPASDYAYGWSTGTVSGVEWAAKDGLQTGVRSYLRLYPTLDLSVAVIMNDRSGSQSAVRLGTDIGDFLATLPN